MSAAPLPKPDLDPAPQPPTSADAEGWALLEALRRRLDDQGAQGRKTQAQVVQLADSIGALVAEQRRRSKWANLNSFVAYVIFTLLVGAGFYLLYRSRAHELVDARDSAQRERDQAVTRAEDLAAKASARDRADGMAWEVYQLLEAGKRSEAAGKLGALAELPLSRTERAVLAARAHETQVMEVDAALKAAAASFKAGRYGDVIAPLEAALVSEPAGARASTMRYFLGVAYAKANALDKATQMLAAAVAADVDQDDARFQLASALDRAGQYAKARTEYDRFATAHPQSPLAVFAMRRSATLARMPAIATPPTVPAVTTPPATAPGSSTATPPTKAGATISPVAPAKIAPAPANAAPAPVPAKAAPNAAPPAGAKAAPNAAPPAGAKAAPNAAPPAGAKAAPEKVGAPPAKPAPAKASAPAKPAPVKADPTTLPDPAQPTTEPPAESMATTAAPNAAAFSTTGESMSTAFSTTSEPAREPKPPAPKLDPKPAPPSPPARKLEPAPAPPAERGPKLPPAPRAESPLPSFPIDRTPAPSPLGPPIEHEPKPAPPNAPRGEPPPPPIRFASEPRSTAVEHEPKRAPKPAPAPPAPKPAPAPPAHDPTPTPAPPPVDRAPKLPPRAEPGPSPLPSFPIERAPAPSPLGPPIEREPAPAPPSVPRHEPAPPPSRF